MLQTLKNYSTQKKPHAKKNHILHDAYRKYKVNSEVKKSSGWWLDRIGKEKDSLMDEMCLEVNEEILELVRGDSCTTFWKQWWAMFC